MVLLRSKFTSAYTFSRLIFAVILCIIILFFLSLFVYLIFLSFIPLEDNTIRCIIPPLTAAPPTPFLALYQLPSPSFIYPRHESSILEHARSRVKARAVSLRSVRVVTFERKKPPLGYAQQRTTRFRSSFLRCMRTPSTLGVA